jgi:UPF0755 protein
MKQVLKISQIIFLLLIILASFATLSIFLQSGTNDAPVTVEIQKGTSANQVASILKTSGVIRRELDFKIASRLLFIQDRIQAGKYLFPPHPLLINVLLKLVKGSVIIEQLRVSFPEGSSIYKMGSILEKEGVLCFEDFRALTQSRSLEGYLFPDTYIFEKNISAEALAEMMQKRFAEVVIPYWKENKNATKYNLHEILTLASIIEKEAATKEERQVISSVFHNRLNIKMALEADPTIKYVLERPSKTVYFNQLKVKSLYNTYLNRGLPPGPICNPGLSSIKAAIYPAKTDYLYFVAKKDGSHIFSATWQEHQRARQKAKR